MSPHADDLKATGWSHYGWMISNGRRHEVLEGPPGADAAGAERYGWVKVDGVRRPLVAVPVDAR